jgi:hypothetical protein
MKHLTHTTRLALAAIAVLALLRPGVAQAQQDPPKDTLAFKAEVSGGFTMGPLIPTEPPIIPSWMSLRGRSDLLGGDVTFVDTHYWQMGVDGGPAIATSLGGVFAAANGDALLIVWDAVPRPDGVFGGYGRFVVRGGRGRFVGASGSGTLISALKGTDEVTQTYEGTIRLPKR